MSGLRIRHLMLAVLACAILFFAVARFEDSCAPESPFFALSYLCGILGFFPAHVGADAGHGPDCCWASFSARSD